jgi:hypothetical protein
LPAATSPAAQGGHQFSHGDLCREREAGARKGAEAERERMAAVFASSASRGRERTAADLLAFQEWSAGEIITRLAALPSDAELARQRKANGQAAAGKVWDRAYDRIAGRKP